jgi:hypothetical protein
MAATAKGLTDEKAARILPGLRAGKTPRLLWTTPDQLKSYCTTHPEYGREALPLMEANIKAACRRKGAHIRNKTHCINGHSFADHGRVAMHKGWKTRQCRACEVMRYHQGGIIKPAVLQKVTAGILAGSSINTFTKPGPNYLVRFSTLARCRRENPEFGRLVEEAISDRLYRGGPPVAAGTFHYEWDPSDLQAIQAMLPDRFPGKNDVVQSIFLALIEGRLDRSLLDKHLRRFVAEYHRQHPTKFAKFGRSRLVSLDEVLFEDGSTTRGDTVSRGLWD